MRRASHRVFLGPICTGLLGGLLLSCNVTDRDLGDGPIGPSSGGVFDTTQAFGRDSVSGNMSIFATPQRVKAGHKDKSVVTARVFDGRGNPVRGRRVQFAANLGTITALDTTDSEGRATAVYTPVPRNGEARVLAAAVVEDTLSVVATSIQLAGLTVNVTPAAPDTLVDRAVPVTVTVTDADGEPVAQAPVSLSGAQASSGTTDGAGRFRTSVIRSTPGQSKVRATSLGAGDSVTVAFWTNPPDSRSRTILLFAEPSRIPANFGETSTIRALVYDDNHNPVPGKVVTFSASHGIITPADTTAADGSAEALFRGMAQNVDATITASVSMADTVRRATTTLTLAGLQVEVKPAASEVRVGDTIPVSIRVRDADGNPLSNVNVALLGAVQSSVRTNPSGQATATVTSASAALISLRGTALGGADSAKVNFLTVLPTGGEAQKAGVGNLRIFMENSKLKASNTDQTTVRVIAFDKFNNPLAGRLVRFTADHGIITGSDTTDSRGEASAVYRAVPLNTNARITATMTVDDSALAVVTTVTLAGLEVEVRPEAADALLNRSVPVSIRIVDGAGAPVPDATIFFNGNPGVGTTNGDGVFRTTVTSGSKKRVLINARALGDSSESHVDFWDVLPGPGTGDVNSIRRMRIFSSRSQLRADNSDVAIVTVILTNEDNNPAVGETVRFTSNLGIIGESAKVDSAGRASVTLRAAPVNGTSRVEATAVGRNLVAVTEVVFSGVTLQLAPERTELKINETAPVEVFLRDASGNAIGGDTVAFTLVGNGASFDNGSKAYSVTLNPLGRGLVRVNSNTAGDVVIRASALNTADSVKLRYSNNTLSVVAADRSISAGERATTTITATYVDGSGGPINGQWISFATNAGTISPDSALTNAQGKATATLTSAQFSGTATVQASSPTGTAQTQVAYHSVTPTKIELTITADNIAVNGGLATLRAVVRDSQNNTVSGVDVNFKIRRGPGGGEEILRPVVKTVAGVASTQLRSGNIPSTYRVVLVEAHVVGAHNSVTMSSKLTISGPAHVVTVARPDDDTTDVPQSGVIDKAVFELFVGAVVQDVNGNMVADGTEVHFSAAVTGLAVQRLLFDNWIGAGSDTSSKSPRYKTGIMDIPFEDINDNNRIDAGIDLDLDGRPAILRRGEDRNGDGNFDWDPALHDSWFDFDMDGVCDSSVREPYLRVGKDSILVFADLNRNGVHDSSEVIRDAGTPSNSRGCALPASQDYPFHTWEDRRHLPDLPFRDNHFAVAIEVSAVTKNGVAQARLRYPRQFADRLFATVNAEANGIRDSNGERFILMRLKEE